MFIDRAKYMLRQVPAVTDAAASDAKNLLKKAARTVEMAVAAAT